MLLVDSSPGFVNIEEEMKFFHLIVYKVGAVIFGDDVIAIGIFRNN